MQAKNPHKNLFDVDYANLIASGLSDETIGIRPFSTVTSSDDLKALGFSVRQSKLVPALYMPRLDKTGEAHIGIIRPHEPRLDEKNGKPKKYEIPYRSKMQVDFPQTNDNGSRIDDPSITLYVTEGIKKGDALAQNGFGAVVDLMGVWNYKGQNPSGGNGVIWPGIDEIPLFKTDDGGKRTPRDVVIAFDSDVARKREVNAAMLRFAAVLEQRGASVRYLYLPDLPDGAKQGADDFFARGGTLDEFLSYIKGKIEPLDVYEMVHDKEIGKLAKSLKLLMTEKGKVQENQYNLQLILGSDAWAGRIRNDDFTNQTFVDDKPFDEVVDGQIVLELGQTYGMGGNHTNIRERAVNVVARNDTFDVLQDWIYALPAWDKTPRLMSWMHDYFGAEPTTTSAWIGWMMIMQLMSRALRPGSQARYVVILIGDQDLGKSESLMALCPEEWFSAYDRNIDTKDALIALQGKWLIEIAELQSFSAKAEIEKLKSFISTRNDSYREVWGKRNVSHPRRVCMVGTTNSKTPLRGEDENTRFFPIQVTKADRDSVTANKNQLFAEALHAFTENPDIPWWNVPDSVADELVETRLNMGEYNPIIESTYRWLNLEKNVGAHETSTTEILDWMDIPLAQRKGYMGRQVAKVLRDTGWVQVEGHRGQRFNRK